MTSMTGHPYWFPTHAYPPTLANQNGVGSNKPFYSEDQRSCGINIHYKNGFALFKLENDILTLVLPPMLPHLHPDYLLALVHLHMCVLLAAEAKYTSPLHTDLVNPQLDTIILFSEQLSPQTPDTRINTNAWTQTDMHVSMHGSMHTQTHNHIWSQPACSDRAF